MKKGNSIQQFLQKCLEQLRKDFTELRWGLFSFKINISGVIKPPTWLLCFIYFSDQWQQNKLCMLKKTWSFHRYTFTTEYTHAESYLTENQYKIT